MQWFCGSSLLLFLLAVVCASSSVGTSFGTSQTQELGHLHRLIRSAGAKRNQQCRYEKLPWTECDPTSGTQRRTLKLKVTPRSPPNCEPVKEISRPCKKVCRYAKGAWSDCVQGEKTRTDTLKAPSTGVGCEPIRTINKKCKTACRYSKSEWSPCESGIKTKTLTLVDGDGPDCEATKVISKQCGGPGKQRANGKQHGRQRGRKNNGGQSEPED